MKTIIREKEGFERAVDPEVEKARSFFIEQIGRMTALNSEALQEVSTRELFSWYKEAINAKPNRDEFEALVKKLAGESEPDDASAEGAYKEFLLAKLPAEVKGRMVQIHRLRRAADIPTDVIEESHAIRNEMNSRMFLGFHVAVNEYDKVVPVSGTESVTVDRGEEIVVSAGNAHYSTSEAGLYKDVFQRKGDVFLYLVEGSESDQSGSNRAYRAAHRAKGWVSTARPLPIITKMKLTPAVVEALGADVK